MIGKTITDDMSTAVLADKILNVPLKPFCREWLDELHWSFEKVRSALEAHAICG